VLFGGQLRLYFQPFSAVPSKELLEVVAVGAISPKGILIEKPLDAAAGADLIGAALRAYRPAHLAVPASPKNDGGTGQSGRD